MSTLSEHTLDVSALTRCYAHHIALDQVTFYIEGPCVIGLLGRNGAGKSTLLRSLAGLDIPAAGHMQLGALTPLTHPRAWRAQVGFMPETPALYPEESPESLLRWHLALHGVRGERATPLVHRALVRCQLQEVAFTPCGQLSFGYQKRLSLAIASAHSPRLLLLDEPVSGLDPAQIIALRELIIALGQEAIVIVSSHILAELARTASRFLVLRHGKLVADTAHDDALATPDSALFIATLAAPSLHTLTDALDQTPIVLRHELIPLASSPYTPHPVWRARLTLDSAAIAEAAGQLTRAGLFILEWRPLDDERHLEARFIAWTDDHAAATADDEVIDAPA